LTLLVLFVGLFAGEGLVLLPWPAYAIGGGVVFGLFLLAAVIVFGNRYQASFAVGPAGALAQSGGREKTVNRVAMLAVAGAGLLAASREVTAIAWHDVERITVHRRERVVTLSSSWRTLLRLHCTAQNFDEVAARVERYIEQAAQDRASGAASETGAPDNSLARHRVGLALATWTLLALAFAFMTRAWYWAADDTALVVLMAVALLIPAGLLGRVGWVLAIPAGALATLALIVTIAIAAETSRSIFGYTYYTYDLDTGAFWLAVAGHLGLMKLSLLSILGRGPFHWARIRPASREQSGSEATP
jgi:hypothetical protein